MSTVEKLNTYIENKFYRREHFNWFWEKEVDEDYVLSRIINTIIPLNNQDLYYMEEYMEDWKNSNPDVVEIGWNCYYYNYSNKTFLFFKVIATIQL